MHIVQSPGGVERYLQTFFKYTNQCTNESILICSKDYTEKNFENLVSKIEQIEMFREIHLVNDFKAIINIRKLIKEHRPDILYLHSSKAGALGRIANFGINNQVIYNPHGWAFCMDCSLIKKVVYALIEKVLANFTHRIIAISECERNRALKFHICSPKKINVILNGIDIEEYTKSNNNDIMSMRKRLNIPQDSYVIGIVGRICKNKAPEIFVEAARKIKEKIPNSFFVLVGDGPDRMWIENLLKEYDLEKSSLITGWVPHPLDYINCFNQGMLLTRWEGFGLVLTEYMICRVPIIATNIDSIPELIKDEFNGILVNVDSVNEIVNSALRIYDSNQLCNLLISNGEEIVKEKFNAKRMVQEHENLFVELFSK